MIGGALPLQGIDVSLENSDHKIIINYKDQEISNSVKKSLDFSLDDWNKIIDILP